MTVELNDKQKELLKKIRDEKAKEFPDLGKIYFLAHALSSYDDRTELCQENTEEVKQDGPQYDQENDEVMRTRA